MREKTWKIIAGKTQPNYDSANTHIQLLQHVSKLNRQDLEGTGQ